MTNRNTAPDAAFACVIDVGGIKYKLLRHHKLDSVRDGTEHDTIDSTMLAFSLRMVDQTPVSAEDQEVLRTHLRDHEAAIARSIVVDAQPDNLNVKDVNRNNLDDDQAAKLVSQQAGGPDGNSSVSEPKTTMTMQPEQSVVVRTDKGTTTAQLAQPNAGGSITGGGSTPHKKGVKDTDGGRPKGDHEDTLDVNVTDDVEKKPSAGLGKPAHKPVVSVGEIDSSRPSIDPTGGEIIETSPGDVEKGAGLPSSSKVAEEGLHSPEEDIKKKGKKVKARGDDLPLDDKTKSVKKKVV